MRTGRENANGGSVQIPAAYGSDGNTAPNMFRGLPYYNVDLSVTKVFKFKEHLNIQFRAEFFNLFNRPKSPIRLEGRAATTLTPILLRVRGRGASCSSRAAR